MGSTPATRGRKANCIRCIHDGISIRRRSDVANETKIFALWRGEEAKHIDELVEQLQDKMSLSEMFAVLFELELNGNIRQLPEKNYIRAF